ncbi:DUF1540 domain-containing protein [Anaerocolumna sedimenticola]|uniref:DUF1540 domain-containing protein n=1 Tax=Anaerocolumna sedimenticola TaxID=2696063 RepID=A0A6P1TPL6_9FIRM|nr:DUF1540 domain-containing protein [Anaerocolumna sedimenticola]QHQ61746.1 DUF1540 domain-containing protein [Anaerocolumna sedimenticola]
MDKKNPSIQCVVSECRYHAGNTDYCTLDQISVGRVDSFSSKSEDTDCESFIAKEKTF